MKLKTLLLFLFAMFLASSASFAEGEEEKPQEVENQSEDEAPTEDDAEKKEKKPETIEELTEESDLIEGLFPIYRDRKTGETRLLIGSDQLNTEYLYFSYVENGASDAGWLTRGSYRMGSAKIFVIRRYFDRVEFVEQNTNYYFDPTKAISRAADANITHAILFDGKIEGEDEEKGLLLVKSDGLFLSEALDRISPLPDPDRKPHEVFSLGKLSKDKSKIREIRNYPENTDVIVEYVFQNDKPFIEGSPAVTDPRFVSVTVQHSLIEAPEEPFKLRYDDPRIGYFHHQVTDLSSTDATPYRDVIERWRLEKKDPEAELSEPKEPIVYWLENTTPSELRPIITKATLRWNEAFEQAGFLNAIEVKIQPDDADWDAGDLRYNVIRWASSPRPYYGGYGPSFMDPRTGEILGADIMLEYSVIGNVMHVSDTLGESMSRAYSSHTHHAHCSVGMHARKEMLFATHALDAMGASEEEKQRLLEEFIYFLTLHEIGHTLGLAHNFRSSHLHSLDEVFDPEITYPSGLYSSVMDYPAIPFRKPGEGDVQYWTTRPGPYDQWAIEYGYSPPEEDPVDESGRLRTILDRSTEAQLAYANDADDMRSPGKAIDPRAMVGDMSSDPIGFAQHQIILIKDIQSELEDRLLEENESYQRLLNGYWTSIYRFRSAVAVISRFIGGVYIDRSMVGQTGSEKPLTPVSLEDQKRAMRILRDELFSPEAFDAFSEQANYLLAQRRGWSHLERTEDPKLHRVALNIQKGILDHLLHARVLTRLTDSSLYGNEYGVDAFLIDLTDAIFEEDLSRDVNTYRQNLQLEYVDRLLGILKAKSSDKVSQSMALNRLKWIKLKLFDNARRGNLSSIAHRENIVYRIDSGLDPRS